MLDDAWYYCLVHSAVEPTTGCAADVRLVGDLELGVSEALRHQHVLEVGLAVGLKLRPVGGPEGGFVDHPHDALALIANVLFLELQVRVQAGGDDDVGARAQLAAGVEVPVEARGVFDGKAPAILEAAAERVHVLSLIHISEPTRPY